DYDARSASRGRGIPLSGVFQFAPASGAQGRPISRRGRQQGLRLGRDAYGGYGRAHRILRSPILREVSRDYAAFFRKRKPDVRGNGVIGCSADEGAVRCSAAGRRCGAGSEPSSKRACEAWYESQRKDGALLPELFERSTDVYISYAVFCLKKK